MRMVKARKRHVQQELPLKRRGGKRPGAGRPPKGNRSSERHKTRPKLTGREPILITARIEKNVGNLRRRGIYHALRFALYATTLRDDFRVVHFSIQRTHLHMIVEAKSKEALSRHMQGLLISAARHINIAITTETGKQRRGRVVADRYHASVLRSPRQVRNAVNYVLNNWRRHGEHRAKFARTWLLDPYSSAVSFGGWKELEGKLFLFPIPETYEPLLVCVPKTWLLRVGWERGGPIPATAVPGRVR